MASNRQKYEPIVRQAAVKYGLDPDLLVAQVNQESGFNPNAVSSAGARGIAQIMPQTAKGWKVNPSDPIDSINAMAKNMASYRNTYLKQGKNDSQAYALALAAYNSGPGNVSKYKGVPPFKETQNYVKRIMGTSPAGASSTYRARPVFDQIQAPTPVPSTPAPQIVAPLEPLSALAARLNAGGQYEDPRFSQALGQLGSYKPTTAIPTSPPIKPIQYTYEESPTAVALQQAVEEANRPKITQPIAPPQQPNLFQEAIAGFTNPITGYTQDEAARQFAGRPLYESTQLAGDIFTTAAPIIAGGLLGGPGGALAGGTLSGAYLGGGAELQRQRLAGEQQDVGKALGAGAISGGLNLLPVVGKGAPLIKRAAANAALQGGAGIAGNIAQQGIEQGTFTPNIDFGRAAISGGIGAAGGAVGGAFESRAPKIQMPERPLAARPPIRTPSVGVVPDQPRVMPQTPSIRQTMQQAMAQAEAPTAVDYAVPFAPKVNQVEYTRPEIPATKVLKPEIQAQLDELNDFYKPSLDRLKQGDSISGSVYIDRQQKGYGYKKAAEKRRIIQGDSLEKVEGGLTDAELAAVIKKENTNYAGKKVLVDGIPAEVRTTVPGGKVQVLLEDGTTRVVPRNQLTAIPKELRAENPYIEIPAQQNPLPDGLAGTDAALYDLGRDPTNEAALIAAREALPGYGDENLRAMGKQVQGVVDNAITTESPMPRNIVEDLVAPKAAPADATMSTAAKPLTPEQIIGKTQALRGSREQMLEMGTVGSVIKNADDYKALMARKSELGSMRANRARDLSDLTPDVLQVKSASLLDAIDSGELRLNSRTADGAAKTRNNLAKALTALETGTIKPRELNALQKKVADLEFQFEKQNIVDQINQLHPEVKLAYETNYDPATGLANQKTLGPQVKTFDEIKDLLTPEQYNKARLLDDVAQNDAKVQIDADTNQTGATSNVGKRLITPLGAYRVDKDGAIAMLAYNPEGHIAPYYLTPKVGKDGAVSIIREIGDVVNQPGYRGEYINAYKGIRQFSIDDTLRRPPRLEGITTLEAEAIAKKFIDVTKDVDLKAINPEFGRIIDTIKTDPRKLTVKTVADLQELMKVDRKLLQKVCGLLGKL